MESEWICLSHFFLQICLMFGSALIKEKIRALIVQLLLHSCGVLKSFSMHFDSVTVCDRLTVWLAVISLPTIGNYIQHGRSSSPTFFPSLAESSHEEQAHFCFYSLLSSILIFFLFLHCTVVPVFLSSFLWRFELSFTSPADGSVLLEDRQQLQAGRPCAASGFWANSCFLSLKV